MLMIFSVFILSCQNRVIQESPTQISFDKEKLKTKISEYKNQKNELIVLKKFENIISINTMNAYRHLDDVNETNYTNLLLNLSKTIKLITTEVVNKRSKDGSSTTKGKIDKNSFLETQFENCNDFSYELITQNINNLKQILITLEGCEVKKDFVKVETLNNSLYLSFQFIQIENTPAIYPSECEITTENITIQELSCEYKQPSLLESKTPYSIKTLKMLPNIIGYSSFTYLDYENVDSENPQPTEKRLVLDTYGREIVDEDNL